MVDRSDQACVEDAPLHGRSLATGPEQEHDVGEGQGADGFVEGHAANEHAILRRAL